MSKKYSICFSLFNGRYPVDRSKELSSPVSEPGYKGGGYGSR